MTPGFLAAYPIVESLDKDSLAQLKSLERFSSKPIVGESYRAVLLLFTGDKSVRLLGKKHFRKLYSFN